MTLRQIAMMAFAIVAASSLTQTQAFAGTTGALQGIVTDQRLTAVAGATVTVHSRAQREQTTSDASGRFTFASLIPGSYAITISKYPYGTQTTEAVTVTAAGSTSVVVRIAGLFWAIDGLRVRSKTSLIQPGQPWDEYIIPSSWP
jgi:Carboxypeptidase regulatory-like domain